MRDPMLTMLRISCRTCVWLCLTLLISACVEIRFVPSAVLAAAILLFSKD